METGNQAAKVDKFATISSWFIAYNKASDL